jgi:hypothetical protein
METLQTLRGAISSEFEVFEGNDSGSAGFFWKNGNSYLLFLFPSREKKGGYWGLDGCGNSGPLKQVEPVLNEIKALSGRRGGSIEVGVGVDIGEVKGAKVSATGNGTSYSALTDQHGRSVFHVPSGRYYIKVTGDAPYEPYFLSYEQPNVTIENGACAQIQFEETVKRR